MKDNREALRTRHGPWSFDKDPPVQGERATIARLAWCIETLKTLGCEVPPGSRLPKLLRLLERLNADPQPLSDPPGIRDLLTEAHRAAIEFMFILIAAVESDPQTTPFTKAKLAEAILGDDLPRAEGEDHARNTQFELYAAALFAISGFTVKRGEPDARLCYLGEDFGIEAKRVRSLSLGTLEGRLKDAARQITGQSVSSVIQVVRGRGLIAVNLDVYFRDIIPDGDSDRLILEFERSLQTLRRASRVLSDRFGIVGILAFGFAAEWRLPTAADSVPRLNVVYPTSWQALVGDDPADKILVEGFNQVLQRVESKTVELRTKVPKKIRPRPELP